MSRGKLFTAAAAVAAVLGITAPAASAAPAPAPAPALAPWQAGVNAGLGGWQAGAK
ncbi:MAG: hypothetical protein QOF96_3858, partial [Actinomycetota bacterium]|nr:hypothetical protein [Actinomycetota bacterium]